MYSSSSLDEIQNEATDEEDLFEQEQRAPTLSSAGSDPKSHNRLCLNSSSGPPSHELDRRDVGADSQEKRAGELVMVSSSSSSSDLSHTNVQTGDCYGGDGHSVYDEGSVAAEYRKDQVASPDTQHFSTSEEISCSMENRENGRLLQPESFELLDISDFEDDVDDYHSDTSSLHVASLTPCREESSGHTDTSSLHVASLTPGPACREESSDHTDTSSLHVASLTPCREESSGHTDTSSLHVASLTPGPACREESSDHADTSRTSSLSSSQTSQSSNHAKNWLSQTSQKQGKHTPGTTV